MGITEFIADVTVQTAVYWANPVSDGYGGTNFTAPVEINCRWDGKTKLITDNQGKQIVSKAQVLLNQDVDEGGYLFLGTLDDLDSAQEVNPIGSFGAYEIKQLIKTPLFKSTTEFVRTVFL